MRKFITLFFLLIPLMGKAQEFRIPMLDQLIDNGHYNQALACIDSLEMISTNSNNAIYKYYKASCNYDLNNFSKSIDFCSSAIKEHNEKDSLLLYLYFLRSLSYGAVGNFDLAIDDTKQLVTYAPNYIPYYINLSYFYGCANDYKSSVEICRKALLREPTNLTTLNNLAYYCSMEGDYENSISFANSGLALAKDSMNIGSFLNNRGFAKLKLKQFDNALKDINESIKILPSNSYAYYNKALVYIELGEIDNICKNLELAKNFGAINMTKDLIDKYCKK